MGGDLVDLILKLNQIIRSRPRNFVSLLLVGRRIMSLGKTGMKLGNIIVLNKKRHIYFRTIEFNFRALLLSLIVTMIYINYLDNWINRCLLTLHNGIPNEVIFILIKVCIAYIITVIMVTYQIASFMWNLYGYNKNDRREMLQCCFEPAAVMLLGCLPIFFYICVGTYLSVFLVFYFNIVIVGIDFIGRVIFVGKYNICKFHRKTDLLDKKGLDPTKDISIVLKNGERRYIDLSVKSIIIKNNDDILILNNADKYDSITEGYRKESIACIDIKRNKVVYKENGWRLQASNI